MNVGTRTDPADNAGAANPDDIRELKQLVLNLPDKMATAIADVLVQRQQHQQHQQLPEPSTFPITSNIPIASNIPGPSG